MLTDALKDRIRQAYASVIEKKSLKPRWGQRQMIAEIANTLGRIPGPGEPPAGEPAVCVIEAGTGTGKTIAYSVAAIPMAQALGKRLVVATATVALQEQFVGKDLPDIGRHSELEFSYALAKGRRRYVCLSKLDRLLAQGQGENGVLPLYPDEFEVPLEAEALPVYTAMIDALGRGEWDGDRDNWPGAIPEPIWFGATTDHSQCSGRRCPNISQCSFYRAREELTHADVIVANHDLVLADLALGGGAILPEPEDCIYIFDEGHHLPDKALSHFASFCRLHTTLAWLGESGKSVAQGAAVLGALSGLQHHLGKLPEQIEAATESLKVAEQVVATLFDAVEPGRDETRLRFPHGRVPESLQPIAATLAAQFDALGGSLSRIESALEDALEDEFSEVAKDELETWHLNMGGMLSRAEATAALWQAYAVSGENEQPPMARWITLLENNGLHGFELRASPILAGELLEEYLWPRAAGVVITSATITALNSFERFILHSGVSREARFKMVASPFDYSRAVFCVPAMNCEPNDVEAHTAALVAGLPEWLVPEEASLVLFSSRRQMLDVYQGIDATWRERILMQGDASRQEMLRQHRERVDAGRGSVIFGLASFAEGVDLPGKYCDHVVIAKIPFAVPDSPIEAGLAEWIEARGGNAFMEISVPDAALKLVQASGRLLRTEEDSGRVTLADRRLLTKRYGRAILDSLPPFQRELH
ncbi:ATP-dependent DNA helicase DinG [Parahaliea mediterranea]|uniref:ATP-dependent DNA helicase DinG n=1 Tax=Parahaliea mediterranea TaxID=651086 RepID=UPI000E2F00FB|nr:ATP-dependent DNA helicase DinG [Parahaliea mediterranea]